MHSFYNACIICIHAFIVTANLVPKLRILGLCTSLCYWILDFLTGRPQVVRMGYLTSSALTLSTGAPQGCVLSPLLYTLFTYDCEATRSSNAMRPPTERRSGTWHHGARTTSSLSTSARLRRRSWTSGSGRGGSHAPIHIDGAEVERVSCFKFLCVFIKDDLTWSRQADSVEKTAQKSLNFLRRLKMFGMSAKTLTSFYRCTIESILSGCITAWFGSWSKPSRGGEDSRAHHRLPTPLRERYLPHMLPYKSTENHKRPQLPRPWTVHTAAVWETLPKHTGAYYQTHKQFLPAGHQASQPVTLTVDQSDHMITSYYYLKPCIITLNPFLFSYIICLFIICLIFYYRHIKSIIYGI